MRRIVYRKGDNINGFTFIMDITPYISPSGNRKRKVTVLCPVCSKEFDALLGDIRSSNIGSCSCVRGENHGLTKHKIHNVWNGMKQRCYNVNSKFYKDYGGRGITVCDAWLNSFKSFYNWCMQNGYEEGLQIDREINGGNYEPGNCRFVTAVVNSRNRRTSKLSMEIADKIRTETDITYSKLGDRYGVDSTTISGVLNNKIWKSECIDQNINVSQVIVLE